MPKKPQLILKKKISDKHILYKVEWSNGSISYEPLQSMERDILTLVQKWEIKKYKRAEEEKYENHQTKKNFMKEIQPENVSKASFKDEKKEINPEAQVERMKMQDISKKEKKSQKELEKNSRPSMKEQVNIIQVEEKMIQEPQQEAKPCKEQTNKNLSVKKASNMINNNENFVVENQTLKLSPFSEENQQKKSNEKNTIETKKISQDIEQQYLLEKEKKNKMRDQIDAGKVKVGTTNNSIEVALEKEGETIQYKNLEQKEKGQALKKQNVIKKGSKMKTKKKRVKGGKKQKQKQRKLKEGKIKGKEKYQETLIEHQPKPSLACTILQAIKMDKGKQIKFLVKFGNSLEAVWVGQIELRLKSPRALVEYLLNRVKWAGNN